MLVANKSKLFEKVFSIYNRNLLKRRFNSLNLIGLDKLINSQNDLPKIIIANHSSWWDGLVIFQIIQKTDLEFFVMMEEKQLKDLRLFRKLGAFSVVRDDARSAFKSLTYAVELLRTSSKNMLLVFPQGKILPNDSRPMFFYNGVSHIFKKVGDCEVFSIALRYEFLGDYKPDIFVKINKIETKEALSKKERTFEFERAMTVELDKLKGLIVESNTDRFIDII